ncbi:MAG: alkane 1-monooxygenase [Flavobacteriales bacterium]|nr:alkane 1-monooxygenase [Flavobacteriales bacterium]
MNRLKMLKYLFVYTAPLVAGLGFYFKGPWTWALPIYAYGVIPLVELLNKGTVKNMSEMEEEVAKKDRIYDYMIYSMVPLQWFMFIFFMYTVEQGGMKAYEYAGLIASMGIGCAALGINVAHELGHRKKRSEQWMSKALLLTAQYMHFFIEHNRGHHKNVSTEEDPATSRYGELVYTFWFRSVIMGYISAWKLELHRLKKADLPWYHYSNEMIFYIFCQVGLLVAVALIFSVPTMIMTLVASIIGFSLLEVINYVEHYGLARHKSGNQFKKVLPIHSWNSNHPMGRLLLFELTRHSDHHYKASRQYQILRHFDDAPQMPTGYPGMIVLALVPPIWFAVMNPRVKALQKKYPEELRIPVAQAA